MDNINQKIEDATQQDDAVYNKPTRAVPRPEANIGIDTGDHLFDNIVQAGVKGQLDISAIDSFSRVSQRRDEVYSLLDSMCEDSTVAAVLETYAEDATEHNEQGSIVWAESSNPDIGKFINFLLDSCRVDKHIYSWINCLCKYGDVYLRLYRKSDYDAQEDLFKDKEPLQESVKIQAYADNDHYVHYMEMEPNPAEIFELTKFGKTQGYIKAEVASSSLIKQTPQTLQPVYKFKKGDVTVFGPTEFVHAALEDNTSRIPEQVDIFLDNQDIDSDKAKYTYKVRRGQSLFYNTFKIWRELTLLENSLLLNRITKSAVTRMINVEVGDMPKEMVGPHLQGIKQLLEQKMAYDGGSSFSEYTNPGPIENNVYVPTHGGIGALTATTVGGDVNVGELTDIDHFKSKYFGALRIPKQYFGYTDDNAGFSGGESLSIISARYAKMIKRIQTTMLECLTDAINLMLLDKGLKTYIGKFDLHMLPPTTSEEVSRKEYVSNSVQLVTDIMNMLSDVTDSSIKLKILKSLLSSIVTDTEVIELIQQQIDLIESENAEEKEEAPTEEDEVIETDTDRVDDSEPLDLGNNLGLEASKNEPEDNAPVEQETANETILPTPDDLGIGDLSDSNNEEIK